MKVRNAVMMMMIGVSGWWPGSTLQNSLLDFYKLIFALSVLRNLFA